MGRLDAKGVIVGVLLVVVAIGALAEIVAGRAVSAPEPPRPTGWQSFLQAGDAARARDDAPAARRAYLKALFRAQADGSTAGVLRAAEGFRALGDREVVEEALRMAAALGPSAEAADRLQALRDRLDAVDALPITVPARR